MKGKPDTGRWIRGWASWLYALALSLFAYMLGTAACWAEGPPPPPPSPPAVPIGGQEVAAIGVVAFLLYMLRGKRR